MRDTFLQHNITRNLTSYWKCSVHLTFNQKLNYWFKYISWHKTRKCRPFIWPNCIYLVLLLSNPGYFTDDKTSVLAFFLSFLCMLFAPDSLSHTLSLAAVKFWNLCLWLLQFKMHILFWRFGRRLEAVVDCEREKALTDVELRLNVNYFCCCCIFRQYLNVSEWTVTSS